MRGRVRSMESFQDFRNLLSSMDAIDLGIEGKPWTWMVHWEGQEIKRRLDIVVNIN